MKQSPVCGDTPPSQTTSRCRALRRRLTWATAFGGGQAWVERHMVHGPVGEDDDGLVSQDQGSDKKVGAQWAGKRPIVRLGV